MTQRQTGAGSDCSAAIIIPARNEARRLPDCLDALSRAISRSGLSVCTVVVVNDSVDETAAIARRTLARMSCTGAVLELGGTPGVGGARARGFDHAMIRWGSDLALLGTDADSRVDEDWLTGMMAELRTADLVFGAVTPDAAELARLGTMQARHNEAEGIYMQIAVRLAAALDPRPHDPFPSHHNASGANFALTGRCLRAIGGFPDIPLSEDRELARRAEMVDLRVRHSDRPMVTTSCRLGGRTSGGMAEALRARCSQSDPLCDEWLEPALTFIDRHRLRGALRACWPDAGRLFGTGLGWGMTISDPTSHDTFGAFWDRLEQTQPSLQRQRIRQSEASRDLPVLRACMDQVEAAGKAMAS